MSQENPFAAAQQALARDDAAALDQAIRQLDVTHGRDPYTWYIKAERAGRKGDISAALGMSANALVKVPGLGLAPGPGGIEFTALCDRVLAATPQVIGYAMPILKQFGQLATLAGMPQRAPGVLDVLQRRVTDPAMAAKLTGDKALALPRVLGLHRQCDGEWAERVMRAVIAPWIAAAVGARQFDTALTLETIAYNDYVKRTESQTWFRNATDMWIPQMAAQARLLRDELGFVHDKWRPEPVRRVALFIHNASMLAHVMVLAETLEAVAKVGAGPYRFTAFVLEGRDEAMHSALTSSGVEMHYLSADGAMPISTRLGVMARRLKEDNFALCLWTSLVTIMGLMFPLRIAPRQVWWAMKYHSCDVAEIDVHMALENVVERKMLEGIEWRTIGNSSANWFDPGVTQAAAEVRTRFPADAILAGSIGREEKLNSPAYLDSIVALLQAHPKLIFLWTGKEQLEEIQRRFDQGGVSVRTHFIGWVNTKLYAQALDLFLDSFPFPCGFTLKEAMAAGKPVVLYRSPESLETGVPGAISPVMQGTTRVAEDVRKRLEATFTANTPYDLFCCASTPEEYVSIAGKLIDDADFRAQSGRANARYIAEFASSPEDEARKFLRHLDEIMADIPTI